MERKAIVHRYRRDIINIGLMFFLVFCFFTNSKAQQDWVLKIDKEQWFKGKVELTSGKVRYGRVNPSSLRYYVLMMKYEGLISGVKCDHVRSFEFYDEGLKRKRKFQYLNFRGKGNESGTMQAGLFEVLVEFDNFALFSEEIISFPSNLNSEHENITEVNYAAVDGGAVTPTEHEEIKLHHFSAQTNLAGNEKVYYLSGEGESNGNRSLTSVSKSILGETKAKFNEGMMKQITRENYAKVLAYAKKYKLDYNNNSEHLVKVMDYYKRIM